MGMLHNISGPLGPQQGLNRGNAALPGVRSDSATARIDTGDRLELSDVAIRLAKLDDRPDARVELVRREIAEGTYESDQRIDATIERLFADLNAFDTHI